MNCIKISLKKTKKSMIEPLYLALQVLNFSPAYEWHPPLILRVLV